MARERVVPARNDLKKVPLVRNVQGSRLRDQDPNYHYEWFSDDPEHPSYIGRKTEPHDYGHKPVGYTEVGPWEVVHRNTDRDVDQVQARTDQGAGVDTVKRHGRMILARIHKDEYAKYAAMDEEYARFRERALDDSKRFGRESVVTRVSRDEDANVSDVLRDSGVPVQQ